MDKVGGGESFGGGRSIVCFDFIAHTVCLNTPCLQHLHFNQIPCPPPKSAIRSLAESRSSNSISFMSSFQWLSLLSLSFLLLSASSSPTFCGLQDTICSLCCVAEIALVHQKLKEGLFSFKLGSSCHPCSGCNYINFRSVSVLREIWLSISFLYFFFFIYFYLFLFCLLTFVRADFMVVVWRCFGQLGNAVMQRGLTSFKFFFICWCVCFFFSEY